MASKSVTITMDREKETKGTFLYRSPDNRKHMIYVLKDDAKKLGNPESIELTIKPTKGE